MKVKVRAQPRSSQQKIVKNEDGSLKAYLRSAPADGAANRELVKLIAEFYKVNKSKVGIISGHASRNKIIEIT